MKSSRPVSGERLRVILCCCKRKADNAQALQGNIHFTGQGTLPSHDVPGENGGTWIDRIRDTQGELGYLHPAWQLYAPPIYRRVHEWQQRNATNREYFILSAGFGFVESHMRIPKYDITFSTPGAHYLDYEGAEGGHHMERCMRLTEFAGQTHLFASPVYVKAFEEQLLPHNDSLVVHVFSETQQHNIGGEFHYEVFGGHQRTNWHYVAARNFVARNH